MGRPAPGTQTAFLFDHRLVAPAYGYRIEYRRRRAVRRYAVLYESDRGRAGAELMVHEVVLAPPDITEAARNYRAFIADTTPEQPVEVLRRARSVLAVYSHVVVFGDRAEAGILQRTKALYAGGVVLEPLKPTSR